MRTRIFVLLLLSIPLVASGRTMRSWSYQEMLDKADLVVIAGPLETRQMGEKAILPDIFPDVHVLGIETTMKVSVTLKGDKEAKTLLLHHFSVLELALGSAQ